MTTRAEFEEMLTSFKSLLKDGSTPETALMQVAFEQGMMVEKARRSLTILVGDLDMFALKVQGK